MAFVFRSESSPRIVHPQPVAAEEEEQVLVQPKKTIKNVPIKGLACHKFIQEQNHHQHSTCDNIVEQIDTSVRQYEFHRKNAWKNSNNFQSMFKSKCSRTIFSDDKHGRNGDDSIVSQFILKKAQERQNIHSIEREKERREQFKTKIKVKKTQNILTVMKSMDMISSIPSIPGKINQLGYFQKDNSPGHFPKTVEKIKGLGEKCDTVGLSEGNNSSKNKGKGIKKFGLSASKHDPLVLPLVEDQTSLKVHNEENKMIKTKLKKFKENERSLKKIGQTVYSLRSQLETRATSDKGGNDSDQSEYESDATPGPGYYNCSVNQKKNFRSKNGKFQKIFINQSKRFTTTSHNEGSWVGYYDRESETEKQKSNNRFFMSRIPRKFLFNKSENIPPPGYYNTRQTMENVLIDKMLKNSSLGMFNNNIPRFVENYTKDVPGPGYYNSNMPSFKIQVSKKSANKEAIEQFSKKLIRTVQQTQNIDRNESTLITLPKQQKKQKKDVIHSQISKPIQEKNYAPFMSSSQKFKYPEAQDSPSKPTRKQKAKIKTNFFPFNSSECKQQQNSDDYKASIGLYDITNRHEWINQSHNVLFN